MDDFIAYQCDEDGFFIGEVLCQRNPKTNKPLLPQYATKVKPPDIAENQNAIFIKDSQEWVIVYKQELPQVDSIVEVRKLLENPSKESIKQAIGILIKLL